MARRLVPSRFGRALRARIAPTRVNLTRRGVSFLAIGSALIVLGAALGLPDLMGLGAAPALATGSTAAWMALRRLDRGRAALQVAREVRPNPAVRGRPTAVRLTVGAVRTSAGAFGRLTRLRISEQAAPDLCERSALRAQVAAHRDRIVVRYRLTPLRRGRWPLGPLLTSRVDIFGLTRARQRLGTTATIAVWPQTVPLPTRATRTLGEIERTAAGARLASSDDSILREYVAGDDPRRVHWVSAARHGQLMVRSDESAGLPPVTVLLDRGLLPHPDLAAGARYVDGEWAVECAASIAVALLGAGHQVRLVPTDADAAAMTIRYGAARSIEGTTRVLDQTLDIVGPQRPTDAGPALAATAKALGTDRRPGEVVVAVLGPHDGPTVDQLGALPADGARWALVVGAARAGAAPTAPTAARLRGHGWRVATVEAGAAIEESWSLLAEDRL